VTSAPTSSAGDEELVDHDLRAVDEVAELRLPEDERVRRRDRVPVLEPERRILRERRVVDLERRVAPERCWIGAYVSPVKGSWSMRWRCANVPRSASCPERRIGMPSSRRLA
jgi:hypothetical protein